MNIHAHPAAAGSLKDPGQRLTQAVQIFKIDHGSRGS
ncbi:hypothetical protein Y695_03508 [Hydrogenophaga sp. T4]|nr:hypothetical protein Y695_03508 [Hydrogenophaga sp. T4]